MNQAGGESEWMCRLYILLNMLSSRPRISRLFLFANLFILMLNLSLMFIHLDTNPVSEFFADEAMTASDRRSMIDLFSVLVDTLDAANVTYFMYGGTLVGSIRHHGPIPWDDDIDILLSAADRERTRSVLSRLAPKYLLYKPDDKQPTMLLWKLYSSEGGKTAWFPKAYRWPFVDIFFFQENETYIWDMEPEYQAAGFVWPKSIVFPLTRRPFGRLTAPAPCSSLTFVATNYVGADGELCAAPSYNHRIDMHRPPWRTHNIIPCSRLWHAFPFVFRSTAADGSWVESLQIGNWTLQTLTMPVVTCSGLPAH